jgi:D-glycero-D-manno-heptose 1,7-bisphosphate phosphatase
VSPSLKICFLDRDGTLNVDTGYACDVKDLQLVPGIKEFLRELHSLSYQFIVITNQSGIARGYYGWTEFENFNRALFQFLQVPILDVFVCPHHPEGQIPEYAIKCDCRKPEPGLFYQAFAKYPNINKKSSFMVGDSLRDCIAAQRAGLRSFLLSAVAQPLPADCLKVSAPMEILTGLCKNFHGS